ncbi:MAG: hypothetical protein KAJ19_09615 [Gammaproteobacteria bacterium]|nr:hypothetical protein [Gammaproteobacteria bacterium]
MTVQIHPVETEADPRLEKNTKSVERKTGAHNPINLWDEHTGVGAIKSREQRDYQKEG